MRAWSDGTSARQANLPDRLKYLEGQRSPHRGSIFPGHLGLGFKIDQRADFAVGSLAPGGMGDLGREELAAGFARRLRDAAAEFAAFAVLAEMARQNRSSVRRSLAVKGFSSHR